MNASPDQPPAASPAHGPDELARRLGTADAAVIGVGSMVGAGVFVAFAPAAAHAGSLLPVALLLAAVVAWCNATSTAQLAMIHPASGGTYVYANRQLGPWAGFTAGWGFVTGKTASAAGMSMAFGLYAATLLGIDDAAELPRREADIPLPGSRVASAGPRSSRHDVGASASAGLSGNSKSFSS